MTTWTQIDSLTAPSAGVFDFPSLTFTGYSVAQIVCTGITVTTDSTDISMTFYVGTEVVTGYRWGMHCDNSSASGNSDGNAAASALLLVSDDGGWDVGNASTKSFGCIITVDAPASTALYKKVQADSIMTAASGVVNSEVVVGIMENAGAITGVKIKGTSNLTAGHVRILGLA